jgi:D-alanyl-D-alanine carboxypeptidase
MSKKVNDCLAEFINLMNQKAQILNLKKSNFAVAHGMHHDNNYSSAYDIGKLCCHAMENEMFKEIVNEQTREVKSLKHQGHVYKWENTNILLKEGFDGIKTGITPTAGPCLAASITKDGYRVVVVVLSCCSMDSRWLEVPKLVTWGIKKIKKIE